MYLIWVWICYYIFQLFYMGRAKCGSNHARLVQFWIPILQSYVIIKLWSIIYRNSDQNVCLLYFLVLLPWHRSLRYWQLALYFGGFGKKLRNIFCGLDGKFGAGTRPLWADKSNMVSKLIHTDFRNFGKKHWVLNSNEITVQKECILCS